VRDRNRPWRCLARERIGGWQGDLGIPASRDGWGQDCHDASTCKLYFNMTGGSDNGRGVADYVNPLDVDAAVCSSTHGRKNCATGADVASNAGTDFLIYWDADELREIENGTSITKDGGGTLLNASGCASNNSTKQTPTLTADLIGDWREELVLRESSNGPCGSTPRRL